MVRGAARLEGSLGLSPIVIGLTVVSLGTSAPELVVAVLATLEGSGDLAVGNILGSNLANILLLPLLMDLSVDRVDGVFLCFILGTYLAYVFHQGKKAPPGLITQFSGLTEASRKTAFRGFLLDVGLLIAGVFGLVLGGKAIVESATFLANELGISDMAIGITVVAVGTSLPELATSLMAAVRKQTDIAVGNVIGSNIFNIAGVLGVAGTVEPIRVAPGALRVEYPAVVILSCLVLILPLACRRQGRFQIRRLGGVILLGAYFILAVWVLV
jgi:cation:H+ antiporter